MRLHFLGATRQVTGSRYLLEAGGDRIMIDCGLFQERPFLARNWEPSPVPPPEVDTLLLTHAHLDHCGLVPKFVGAGFAGDIHATPASVDLARIVLEDAARIQVEDTAQKKRRHEREGRRGPHPEIPLYTPEDAEAALARFRIVPYDRPLKLNAIEACWRDAGHILGSSMLEVTVREGGRETRIIFSGDIGQWDRPLMHDPTVFTEADYLVMESTYGDRDHEPDAGLRDRLADIVNDTVRRGGNVLIPTFAIDRAQEVMLHLGELVREERIPRITTFLDSPMAIDVTSVYKRFDHLLDDDTREMLESGRHPFQFPGLHFVRNAEESRAINSLRGSCIILAGSGMCTGGRIKHHLRHNISRPESTVLFVGYQARDTLGRHILEGDEDVRIHGRHFTVAARIERLDGLSAHADRTGLLRWVSHFRKPPQRLFLTHGEETAMGALGDAIRVKHGFEVHAPEYEEVVEL